MKNIYGTYTNAFIGTNNIEEQALEQAYAMINHKNMVNAKVAFMPDVHYATNCNVGSVIKLPIENGVNPDWVSADIYCGVMMYTVEVENLDLVELDNQIHKVIKHGTSTFESFKQAIGNKEENEVLKHLIQDIRDTYLVDKKGNPTNAFYRGLKSLNSLGGGNHFIEILKDGQNENLTYITVHTGSRYLGAMVHKYYSNEMQTQFKYEYKEKVNSIVEYYKNRGEAHLIQDKLYEFKSQFKKTEDFIINPTLLMKYIKDVEICGRFAKLNRTLILDKIVSILNGKVLDKVDVEHNYLETIYENGVLTHTITRKGATNAEKGKKLLIPLNMRDGMLVGIGKGNETFLKSAPHGAGRKLSRTEARNRITLKEMKEDMKGIYTTSLDESTIDESSFAYKDANEIIENVKETVEIIQHLKPIYNFKSHTVDENEGTDD